MVPLQGTRVLTELQNNTAGNNWVVPSRAATEEGHPGKKIRHGTKCGKHLLCSLLFFTGPLKCVLFPSKRMTIWDESIVVVHHAQQASNFFKPLYVRICYGARLRECSQDLMGITGSRYGRNVVVVLRACTEHVFRCGQPL